MTTSTSPIPVVRRHRIAAAISALRSHGITTPDFADDPDTTLTIIHRYDRALRTVGIDTALIPTADTLPRHPRPTTEETPQFTYSPPTTEPAAPADPATQVARFLAQPGAGESLLFDGTLDSLRGVPLDDLDGVDDDTLTAMGKAGVGSVWDLLMRIPRRYLDRSTLTPLAMVTPGSEATFIAQVRGVSTSWGGRGKPGYARFTVTADGATASCMFFNAAWMSKRFSRGDQVLVHGDVTEFNDQLSLSNPMMTLLAEDPVPIVGVYPQSTTNGLTTWDLQRAAVDALRRIPAVDDPIPAALLERYQLPSRLDALQSVHVPVTPAAANRARQRLVFDELLRLQLALGVLRNAQQARSSVTHAPTGTLVGKWRAGLPYALTGAQDRAIGEIVEDMASPKPMNRLLQGDVGAGKTAVITAAALTAVEGGHQAVIAVPSQILARQHYEELHEALGPLGVQVDLLVSTALPRPKRQVRADLASGACSIVVGTHSVFSPDVDYASLGLVIVDEQHRFGVDQRSALSDRGAGGAAPDVLQATATPIPRTAAITEFGDMTTSVLDEKPAGRKPVVTRHLGYEVTVNPAAPCWEDVRRQVAAGRQAFVVCPLVFRSGGQVNESKMAAAAEDVKLQLEQDILSGLRVGMVHGKQKPPERGEQMDAFTVGEVDVLVATTVIEVGVSVPNAAVMVILGAGKFGLAQLHQLRGRVGRGQWPGSCWLAGEVGAEGQARMDAMCQTTDGFVLSEMDLQIRGPGSLISSAQAGKESGLVLADLIQDEKIHLAARREAHRILERDPQLGRHRMLRAEVREALGEQAEYLLRS
jgi:ATP-dependent DNA helicase RecG